MHFLLYKHFVGCNAGIVTSLLNAESVDLHYTKCVPARYTTPRHSARHGTASLRFASLLGVVLRKGVKRREGGEESAIMVMKCLVSAMPMPTVAFLAATVSTMLTTHCYSDDVCVETTTT